MAEHSGIDMVINVKFIFLDKSLIIHLGLHLLHTNQEAINYTDVHRELNYSVPLSNVLQIFGVFVNAIRGLILVARNSF